jgi:hypothetical protein
LSVKVLDYLKVHPSVKNLSVGGKVNSITRFPSRNVSFSVDTSILSKT